MSAIGVPASSTTTAPRAPALRTVLALFAVAFAVSVVHYVDNYANYADFPQDGPIPDPSRGVVGAAWFLFTAAGLSGLALLRRGDLKRAAIALAVYSGSGLVGFGHYTVSGAFDMPWWRQAHIVADIALGITMLVVAVRLARAANAAGR
ncbi:hypothetical protein [Conexibacter sp. SYSU D00693]|uniref:hypothetical protein n=1 Tax=Conexibacter sp. SYSU D00693 TaxID=2812560 RepID=UPI00196A1ED9|nr:hypothetical protein [Conexibacter sp. SYSU D00693]